MVAARCSTRRSVARGHTSSALPANSPRNSSMLPSNGSDRQVSGSSRTGASGKAVCQPVKVTLSYCWSLESHPSTTCQNPMPWSSAEKNFWRSIYFPRRIPSLSKTPTLTCCRPRSSTIARACALVRTSSGCMQATPSASHGVGCTGLGSWRRRQRHRRGPRIQHVQVAGAECGERTDDREGDEHASPAKGNRESCHDGAREHAAQIAGTVDQSGGDRARLLAAEIESESPGEKRVRAEQAESHEPDHCHRQHHPGRRRPQRCKDQERHGGCGETQDQQQRAGIRSQTVTGPAAEQDRDGADAGEDRGQAGGGTHPITEEVAQILRGQGMKGFAPHGGGKPK